MLKKTLLMYRREFTNVFGHIYMRVNDKNVSIPGQTGNFGLSQDRIYSTFELWFRMAFLTRKFLFGTADELVPSVQRFRNGLLMDAYILVTVPGSRACRQTVGQLKLIL